MLPEPESLALEKQEEELAPQPPPKRVSVKVTIERTPERISKVSLKKKPTVISKIYRIDNSMVRSGMALVGEKGEHLGSFPAITANY